VDGVFFYSVVLQNRDGYFILNQKPTKLDHVKCKEPFPLDISIMKESIIIKTKRPRTNSFVSVTQ
jgi:hypothetical protein